MPSSDMRDTNLYFLSGDGSGQLVAAKPTKNEMRMGMGYHRNLEILTVNLTKGGKDYWRSDVTSKVFGKITYVEQKVGRRWLHIMRFKDEPQAFYYSEMRHGLQCAIYAMSGEHTELSLSFDRSSVQWSLESGKRMSKQRGLV